ncbi:LamG-like jellyroll fold domain-containing protein [Candidatus Latescibacterota bacterium]
MKKKKKEVTWRYFAISTIVSLLLFYCSIISAEPLKEPGLLFHLSGDKGYTADYSNGDPDPSFLNAIEIIPDGAVGNGFRCPDFRQIMVYFAPGNIFADRGTIAFHWRARDPWGSTPFHILQIPYSDHSSLDMIWLRLDYNGHGFDTFVTDINLARVRVSHTSDKLPAPDEWMHFAIAWDQTRGIRFYIDGTLAGAKDTTAVFHAGLDQFGMHGRLISPQCIRTELNHTRGGDVDEIRIYDMMLESEHIARLARGETAGRLPESVRSLDDNRYRHEWLLRFGWDKTDDIPPVLDARSTRIRKVGIHKVYDLKQWIWKGNDGIRETTWPYVYNRSRLPGRTDYFIEPDWNCYSLSGKSVTFMMPDEPWNYLEISGAAHGTFTRLVHNKENQQDSEDHLFDRPKGRERTFHLLDKTFNGGDVRFVNEVQETPISEFTAFHIEKGQPPVGTVTLTYSLTAGVEPDNPSLDDLVDYINGRFLPDERQIMVALPGGAPRNPKRSKIDNPLPLIHVLVPYDFRNKRPRWSNNMYSYTWENMHDGLDGIAIDIPALDVQPTHGDYFPMNIQVKDPIWPDRNLFDCSFSVKPGEAKTVWLDTRDRILPNGYSLYLTIAGAGSDLSPKLLNSTRLRLIFKDREEARTEHELDRFTQVVDNWGNICECGPNSKKLRMYDRFIRDITDLLRVNPDHEQGRYYWSIRNGEQGWPPFVQPEAPAGVPLWAFRQVENLKKVKEFITWWIDERQIENGEFGGGLSDDGDMTNQWPALALMGVEREKVTDSILREMEAFYANNMFTNGLPTIVTDELHVYEEGINVIPQCMLLDYGNPKVVERLMKTAKAYELITDINDRGNRQISTGFFSGDYFSKEGVWGVSKQVYAHLILHAGLVLVEYNGHPAAKKLLLEVADGLLAYRKKGPNDTFYLPDLIFYPSGKDEGIRNLGYPVSLFWASYRWTGDDKYLLPIMDELERGNYNIFFRVNNNFIDHLDKRDTLGPEFVRRVTPESGSALMRHTAWQVTGNKQFLEGYYADQIQTAYQCMDMYTEGHWWSDRVGLDSTGLQRSRLGGIALVRSSLYPGHAVSWSFRQPATGESVAILVPDATPTSMTVIAHNLEKVPVTADMTAWDIDAGTWEVIEGIDTDGDDAPDGVTQRRKVKLERTGSIELTFPPGRTSVIRMKLTSKARHYWKRPDLGIGVDDLSRDGNSVTVTVHSLGSVDAPGSTLVLVDRSGTTLATAPITHLSAPLDYLPKTVDVKLTVPSGTNISGCTVVIDPDKNLQEITRINNEITIP